MKILALEHELLKAKAEQFSRSQLQKLKRHGICIKRAFCASYISAKIERRQS